MKIKLLHILFISFLIVTASPILCGAEMKEFELQDKSEELSRQYLDAFKKSGVPTPLAFNAAFEKARTSKTIELWHAAASIANSYANVIAVLKRHYIVLYDASKHNYQSGGTKFFIEKAAEYEQVQNRYLQNRNDAYIELAKLYLASGDKAKALSYAVMVVSLSGIAPNYAGEELIKTIIEYQY